MKKIIVSTTINPVTEAISKFQSMDGWDLIVAGDRKTPNNYRLSKGLYLSPEMQEKMDPELSEAIGWNCIQRRNFALLKAYQEGADIVALVDDDNIPYDHWGKNLLIGKETDVNFHLTDLPAFDPIGATNEKLIWHRGFPLPLVSKRLYNQSVVKKVKPDIQADFWNGDPDIDAICRMEHAPECNFDPKLFPLASNQISPFNSQNTFISRQVIREYFLYPHVGRMDDIWASYYVQAKGFTVVFEKPSVYQRRNEHNLIEDMKKEYLGYEHNLQIVTELKQDSESILKFLPKRSIEALNLYRRHFSHD